MGGYLGATPVVAQIDGYNKAQADALLAAKVAKAGDTMSGALLVQQSISTNQPDGNFNLGGPRGFLDFVYQTKTARVGAVNGGGAGTQLELYANNNTVMKANTLGHLSMPYQPSSAWRQSVSGSSNNRVCSILRGAGYVTSITPPQGSNTGSVGRFTAPVDGRYLVNIQGGQMTVPRPDGGTAGCLISCFGNWAGSINAVQPAQEVIDTRGARFDDGGCSFVLYLYANDYICPDYYTSYESGGWFTVDVNYLG